LPRFAPDTLSALTEGRTLLVESPQRAAAVQAAFAADNIAAGRRAWRTPPVKTFAHWARQRLELGADASSVRLLGENEEWAVLRQVAQQLGDDYPFVTRTVLTGQLRSALRMIEEWDLRGHVKTLGVAAEDVLLAEASRLTATHYEELRARPLSHFLSALTQGQERPAVLRYAALSTLQRTTLERAGAVPLDSRRANALAPRRLISASTDDEDEAVATWCRAHLQRDPQARLLIVAPDLNSRRWHLERALSQQLEPSRWATADDGSRAYAIEGGRTLADFPLVAGALQTLALLVRDMPFDELSSWLRGPYTNGAEREPRARLDLALRRAAKQQLDCSQLARVALANPETQAFAQGLQAAREMLLGSKRSPREWGPLFEQALAQAGWTRGRTLDSAEQQTRARWLKLLGEYSSLVNVLPAMNSDAAVAALTELAAQVRFDTANTDAPVVVTDALHVPVVQYDGIWILGLDADHWPLPPAPHALLPLVWQTRANIPGSTVESQSLIAERMRQQWGDHADELVFSAPRMREDVECAPSVALRNLEDYTETDRVISLAAVLRDTPRHESIVDTRGVPWDTTRVVSGGVRAFELQTRCAFRSYAELRLAAAALETPQSGIDVRDRGDWLHRAMALFWERVASHAELMLLDSPAISRLAHDVVETARAERARRWRGDPSEATLARESLRLAQLVATAAEGERERTPFKVSAVESQHAAHIGAGQFSFKIDRIDTVTPPGAAPFDVLTDYKSGTKESLDWLTPRLDKPQLLVYLAALADRPIRGVALQYLTARASTYAGYASERGVWPTVRPPGVHWNSKQDSTKDAAAWDAAANAWRGRVTQLANDFVGGIAAVNPASRDDCEYCHLATLCRRAELNLSYANDAHDASDETADE
jgi:ATP-dependent helicase/nuclease subunit B